MSDVATGQRRLGMLAAGWGIAGVVALLAYAIVRLGAVAFELVELELEWHHLALLGVSVSFMAYAEGYRGFQCAFAPRTVARAQHLRDHPSMLHGLLAPLFCMGYFHATRRRLVATYSLTTMIVAFVLVAHSLDQPWRGILDAGVVVGLGWGVMAVLLCARHGFASSELVVSPELPVARAREVA